MCEDVRVILPSGDIWCSNFGELQAALGVVPVLEKGYGYEPATDWCLCPVDLKATAQRAGMSARCAGFEGAHLGEWEFRPRHTRSER